MTWENARPSPGDLVVNNTSVYTWSMPDWDQDNIIRPRVEAGAQALVVAVVRHDQAVWLYLMVKGRGPCWSEDTWWKRVTV